MIEEDGKLVIKGHGCPISKTVQADARYCVAMEPLLARLTGLTVRERCDHAERPGCRFEVELPALKRRDRVHEVSGQNTQDTEKRTCPDDGSSDRAMVEKYAGGLDSRSFYFYGPLSDESFAAMLIDTGVPSMQARTERFAL